MAGAGRRPIRAPTWKVGALRSRVVRARSRRLSLSSSLTGETIPTGWGPSQASHCERISAPHEGTRGVLSVIACAAPAATDLHRLVPMTQAAGWQVHVITTPRGERFVNVAELEHLTSDLVRSTYRMPQAPKGMPLTDTVIVAPATFNTINNGRTASPTHSPSVCCAR
ncbi:flavoprotein [Nonomuraea sp. NPDC004702]